MRIRRNVCLLAALLLWLGMPMAALAEMIPGQADGAVPQGRSIYIGDVVTLDIAAGGMSAEAIKEAFGGFDILALEETSKGFRLSLRSFEVGTHAVRIGDREIMIHVASTLADMERDDIFEGSAEVLEPGLSVPWRALLYAASGICMLCGSVVLIKAVFRRKAKELLPYPLLLQRAGALLVQSDRYLEDLTYILKAYLECLFSCRLTGKTTAETLRVLEGNATLARMIPDIRDWLEQCDRMKFTGRNASDPEKQALQDTMLVIAGRIHAHHAAQSAEARKKEAS